MEGDETEHLAKWQIAALLLNVHSRIATRFAKNVRHGPVREHLDRRRVARVLIGKQLDGLDDEGRIRMAVHALVGVAGFAALAAIRRVPFRIDRLHSRSRVAAARDLACSGVVVGDQGGGIRR